MMSIFQIEFARASDTGVHIGVSHSCDFKLL